MSEHLALDHRSRPSRRRAEKPCRPYTTVMVPLLFSGSLSAVPNYCDRVSYTKTSLK